MNQALLSTLMHTVEIAAVILVAYLISKLFHVEGENGQALIGLVLAALAKFARASDSVAVPDYVNQKAAE